MKNIAIICAGSLPVPAVLGGAAESMLTNILKYNSANSLFYADVFSFYNEQAESESLSINNACFHWYTPNTAVKKTEKLSWFSTRVVHHLSKGFIPLYTNFIKFCAEIINKNNYDCVLLEGGLMQVRQLRQSLKPGTKIVLHIHTDVLNNITPIDGPRVLKALDKLIAVSDYELGRVFTLKEAGKLKTAVVKNAIDIEKFKPCEDGAARKHIREQFGFSEDDKVLVFCGRLSKDKGISDLIDALIALDESYKLLVVGSTWFGTGREDSFSKELQEKAAVTDGRIKFTGYIPQSELYKYYNACDLAVFPSKIGETAGLVAIEALACGVPVIIPNFGGMKEYASENVSIRIDTVSNCAENIKSAVESIFSDPSKYNSMKSEARESVLQFNVETQCRQLIDSLNF